MTAEIGSEAPLFDLPTDEGKRVGLKFLRGKPVVIYFYPKDDTPGCTAQACDFRDQEARFQGLNATVIGISKDNVASHARFKKKFNLPFRLASDEDGKVCEAYGAWQEKSMYGKTYMGIDRSTFLVDANGIVRAIWRKVKVPGHVEEVAKALEAL